MQSDLTTHTFTSTKLLNGNYTPGVRDTLPPSLPLTGRRMVNGSEPTAMPTNFSSGRQLTVLRTHREDPTRLVSPGQPRLSSSAGTSRASTPRELMARTSTLSMALTTESSLLAVMITVSLPSSMTRAVWEIALALSEATPSTLPTSSSATATGISGLLVVTIRPSCSGRDAEQLDVQWKEQLDVQWKRCGAT